MAIKQQSKNLKYTEAVDMLAPLMFDDDEFDRAEQFKVKKLLRHFLFGLLTTFVLTEALIFGLHYTSYFHALPYFGVAALMISIFISMPVLYFFVVYPVGLYQSELEKIHETLKVTSIAFQSHDAIAILDNDYIIIRANHAFVEITGFLEREVIGRSIFSLIEDRPTLHNVEDELFNVGRWYGELVNIRKTGERYPIEMAITRVGGVHKRIAKHVAIFSDITSRKEAEQKIQSLAFYDSLTNLPNRQMLLDRLRFAMLTSGRNKFYGAVIFLDLDHFKELNDSLGHDSGDSLLVEVARRMSDNVREVDMVSRFGGDEFVILLEHLDPDSTISLQKASQVAHKVKTAISQPFLLNYLDYYLSASMGVCLFQGSEVSADEVIRRADISMYQSKNTGRDRVSFYDQEMKEQLEKHTLLKSDLHSAIIDNQIRLYYQVQVNDQLEAIGAEILVRWEHPTFGLLPPNQFIPIAEESSSIYELGHWVLDQACKQIMEWAENPLTSHLVLSVNVSHHQFKQPDFVEHVASMVNKYQIDGSKLKLELTENIDTDNLELIVKSMHALKQIKGLTLALDDFGTAYSSLSFLRILPIDEIKIDQSFMHEIPEDRNSSLMVKTITDMASNFGFSVIAEGVETLGQLEFLRNNNCHAYQGYLFSKAVPLENFIQLLETKDFLARIPSVLELR